MSQKSNLIPVMLTKLQLETIDHDLSSYIDNLKKEVQEKHPNVDLTNPEKNHLSKILIEAILHRQAIIGLVRMAARD